MVSNHGILKCSPGCTTSTNAPLRRRTPRWVWSTVYQLPSTMLSPKKMTIAAITQAALPLLIEPPVISAIACSLEPESLVRILPEHWTPDDGIRFAAGAFLVSKMTAAFGRGATEGRVIHRPRVREPRVGVGAAKPLVHVRENRAPFLRTGHAPAPMLRTATTHRAPAGRSAAAV